MEENALLLYGIRWIHYVSGVCWIGLLYFLNLVNVPLQGKLDAGVKKVLTPELMPRVLFWFRWAAMFTFLSGLTYYAVFFEMGHMRVQSPNWTIWILLGLLLGKIMWFNVWVVIWPNQRKIINGVKSGNPADPSIPKKALLFSRINTFLSVPMLFFMGYGRHAGGNVSIFSVEGLVVVVLAGAIGSAVVLFAIKQSATISTEV
ncbi:MAG: urate hydroxylase PuuD [Leptospiraceae bacterium]|nr:urate hydroxylase PuuD [Leptospiraceae bacterium]